MNYGIVGKHSSSFIYVKEGKNELLKGSHSPLSSPPKNKPSWQ